MGGGAGGARRMGKGVLEEHAIGGRRGVGLRRSGVGKEKKNVVEKGQEVRE